jgi:hypothetical protein
MASAGASAPTPRIVGVAAPSVRLEWNAFSASVVTEGGLSFMHQLMNVSAGPHEWIGAFELRQNVVCSLVCGFTSRIILSQIRRQAKLGSAELLLVMNE